MTKPIILDHPLIQHKLTLLRDRTTPSKDFRELTREISMLMCYEVTRNLPLTEVVVETPLAETRSKILSGRKLAFVPILRAGLGMCDGMLALVPAARVGHVGVCRDEVTHQPCEYYCKLPDDVAERDVIVLDPMLATGGSAIDAVTAVKRHTPHSVKLVCLVAAPEGVEALLTAFPDLQIYAAALDEGLDENKYILPGLGDAGDRLFGTK